jgi:hypothetical protein
MVQITIENDTLIMEVEGLDKMWSLKSRLEIPLKHVSGVRADPETAREWWSGIRLPGANLPGVIKAGTFYSHGQRIFWDIHHPDNGIVIELADDRYNELVVEVDDPAATVAQIQAAMKSAHDSEAD